MDIISEKGGKLLENAELFDVYRGKQIESGKKSVAFALTYRDAGKTLTDDEVSKVHNNILSGLEKELNAVLREV
jgi:phenylalanyl-tRNA synthetase beta chain